MSPARSHHFFRPVPPLAVAGGLVLATCASVSAASVTLTASDAINLTSFNTGLNWSDTTAPSALNDYFTGAFTLRSLPSGGATFAGNSLSLDTGGVFAMKSGTLHTVPNFILNGGLINNSGFGGSGTETGLIGGAMTVNTTSTLQVGGGTGSNLRNLNISATIGGSAGLTVTKTGALTGETLTLSGTVANTYAGVTTVNNGATLSLSKTAGVSAVGGDIVLNNNSTLTRTAANQIPDGASVTVNGTARVIGTTAETLANLTVNSTTASIFSGLTVTGTTSITAGILHDINSNASFTTGTLSLSGGSVLRLGANGPGTTVTIGGGGLVLNGGTLQWGQPGSAATALVNLGGNVTASGTNTLDRPNSTGPRLLDLGGAARTFDITSGSTIVEVDVQNGGIVKSGAGTLVLSGNNSYAGNTVINASSGTFRVGFGTATGSLGSGTVSIGSGSTLTFRRTNTITVPNDISGDGTIRVGLAGVAGPATGQIVDFTGDNSGFTGGVFIHEGGIRINDSSGLGDTSVTKTIAIVDDNSANKGRPHLRLNSSGPGIVLPASFTLTTSNGDISAAPGTIVNEAGSNVINGNISLVGGGGDTRVASLGGDLTLAGTLSPGISGGRILYLAGTATGSVSGSLNNGVSALSLRKEGSGTWTLSGGTSNFTGATQVNGGTLRITSGNEQSLGANPGAFAANHLSVSGGTLQVSTANLTLNDTNRGVTVATGGTFEVDSGVQFTLLNNLSATGATVNKTGAGTFNLNGGATITSLTLSEGVLRQSAGTVNLTSGSIGASGTYRLEGGMLRVDNLTVNGAFEWANGVLTHNTTNTGNPLVTDVSSPGYQEVGVGNTATVTGDLTSGVGSVLAVHASPTLYLSGGVRFNNFAVDGDLNLAAAGDVLELELSPYLLRPFSQLGASVSEIGSIPLVTWTGTRTGEFDLAMGVGNDGRGFSESLFPVLDASGLDTNTYWFEYDDAAQTLFFHYNVAGYVPEPGSFGLLAAGVLVLRLSRTLAEKRRRLA